MRHIPYTSPHIPHSCVANAICLSPLFQQLISWYDICLSRYLAPGSIMGSDLVGGGDGGCMPDESISAVSLRHVIFNPVAFKNAPVVVCGTVVLLDKDRMDLSQDGAKLIVELSQLDEAVLRSLKLSAKVLVRGRVHKQQRRTYMVAERVALPQKSRSPDPASEAAPKGDAELWTRRRLHSSPATRVGTLPRTIDHLRYLLSEKTPGGCVHVSSLLRLLALTPRASSPPVPMAKSSKQCCLRSVRQDHARSRGCRAGALKASGPRRISCPNAFAPTYFHCWATA